MKSNVKILYHYFIYAFNKYVVNYNFNKDGNFNRLKISEAKSDDGMTSLLELIQSETGDAALYQCKAGNPFGADVYSVYLSILGMTVYI